MSFSIRDRVTPLRVMNSQSGATLIEYLLMMVVTFGIVLGGVYQLNAAFRTWSASYFGDYFTCLLETGELPTIDGTPGDSGTCNSLFQPFSLTQGRPLVAPGGNSFKSGPAPNVATNSYKSPKGQGGGGGAGGGRTTYRSGAFTAGGAGQSSGFGDGNGIGSNIPANTGNTGVSKYGGNYTALNRRLDTKTKRSLDNRFAFEDEASRQQKRSLASTTSGKKASEDEALKASFRVRPAPLHKDEAGTTGAFSMTIGNFIKWLLIAAIIIVLVVLIGGQMLQVSKSME